MKSGHGSFRRKRTRYGSTTSTAATFSFNRLAAAPLYRSNENFTSSVVSASPLWNTTPLRTTNSYTSPSFDVVQDSASDGANGLPGIGFTIASCTAVSTIITEMIPVCSAGSNQIGASEMWTAHVICPAGASERACASPGVGAYGTRRASRRIRIASERRAFMGVSLRAEKDAASGAASLPRTPGALRRRAEHLVDLDLVAVSQAVRLVGHADDGHQLAQHRLGHAAAAGRRRVRSDAVVAAVGGAHREVDHLLGERVERARRHHRFECVPRASERRRMAGQGLPEVVHTIDLPRRHDVVVDRADFGARLGVFDQFDGRHDASCSVHARYHRRWAPGRSLTGPASARYDRAP